MLVFVILFSVQPDRPEGPIEVSDIRPTQLRLSWKPPKNDGGSPIISYIVSKKSPYQTYSIETTVGKTKDTEFLVTNLEEGRGYLFYVRAQNKIGNSEALEVKNRTSVAKGESKKDNLLMDSKNIFFPTSTLLL